MRCSKCPMYHYWSNESDKGEACAIFGDGWDSQFQYEDKEGTIIGCYLDKHYIDKANAERDEYYESMAQYFIDNDLPELDLKGEPMADIGDICDYCPDEEHDCIMCPLGNPCLNCEDYGKVNSICMSNGGCAPERRTDGKNLSE